MPTWRITDPKYGITLDISGDTHPSDADLDELFKPHIGKQLIGETALPLGGLDFAPPPYDPGLGPTREKEAFLQQRGALPSPTQELSPPPSPLPMGWMGPSSEMFSGLGSALQKVEEAPAIAAQWYGPEGNRVLSESSMPSVPSIQEAVEFQGLPGEEINRDHWPSIGRKIGGKILGMGASPTNMALLASTAGLSSLANAGKIAKLALGTEEAASLTPAAITAIGRAIKVGEMAKAGARTTSLAFAADMGHGAVESYKDEVFENLIKEGFTPKVSASIAGVAFDSLMAAGAAKHGLAKEPRSTQKRPMQGPPKPPPSDFDLEFVRPGETAPEGIVPGKPRISITPERLDPRGDAVSAEANKIVADQFEADLRAQDAVRAQMAEAARPKTIQEQLDAKKADLPPNTELAALLEPPPVEAPPTRPESRIPLPDMSQLQRPAKPGSAIEKAQSLEDIKAAGTDPFEAINALVVEPPPEPGKLPPTKGGFKSKDLTALRKEVDAQLTAKGHSPETLKNLPLEGKVKLLEEGAPSSVAVPPPPSPPAELPKPPTTKPAPNITPEPSDGHIPNWLQQNIDTLVSFLKPEVLDKIRALAIERKTANEIANLLGINVESVKAARLKLGIPSQVIAGPGVQIPNPEFEVWRNAQKKSPSEGVRPTERLDAAADILVREMADGKLKTPEAIIARATELSRGGRQRASEGGGLARPPSPRVQAIIDQAKSLMKDAEGKTSTEKVTPGERVIEEGLGDKAQATQAVIDQKAEAARARLKGRAPVVKEEIPEDRRAFHGTPAKFDKYDTAKEGEGAGGNLFGPGIYLSDVPKVAGSYVNDIPGSVVRNQRLPKGTNILDLESGKEASGVFARIFKDFIDPYSGKPIDWTRPPGDWNPNQKGSPGSSLYQVAVELLKVSPKLVSDPLFQKALALRASLPTKKDMWGRHYPTSAAELIEVKPHAELGGKSIWEVLKGGEKRWLNDQLRKAGYDGLAFAVNSQNYGGFKSAPSPKRNYVILNPDVLNRPRGLKPPPVSEVKGEPLGLGGLEEVLDQPPAKTFDEKVEAFNPTADKSNNYAKPAHPDKPYSIDSSLENHPLLQGLLDQFARSETFRTVRKFYEDAFYRGRDAASAHEPEILEGVGRHPYTSMAAHIRLGSVLETPGVRGLFDPNTNTVHAGFSGMVKDIAWEISTEKLAPERAGLALAVRMNSNAAHEIFHNWQLEHGERFQVVVDWLEDTIKARGHDALPRDEASHGVWNKYYEEMVENAKTIESLQAEHWRTAGKANAAKRITEGVSRGQGVVEGDKGGSTDGRSALERREGKGAWSASDIDALSDISAQHTRRGTLNFAEFSRKMREEFGDEVVPELAKLYAEGRERTKEVERASTEEAGSGSDIIAEKGKKLGPLRMRTIGLLTSTITPLKTTTDIVYQALKTSEHIMAPTMDKMLAKYHGRDVLHHKGEVVAQAAGARAGLIDFAKEFVAGIKRPTTGRGVIAETLYSPFTRALEGVTRGFQALTMKEQMYVEAHNIASKAGPPKSPAYMASFANTIQEMSTYSGLANEFRLKEWSWKASQSALRGAFGKDHERLNAIWKRMDDEAHHKTATSRNYEDKVFQIGKSFQRFPVLGELFLPFFKIAYNLNKQSIVEYSPVGIARALGLLDKVGGKVEAADQANMMTRGMTGMLVMGLGYLLAAQGKQEGGADPDYPRETSRLAQGKIPYGTTIGGKQRDITKLPLGHWLGFMGDLVDIQRRKAHLKGEAIPAQIAHQEHAIMEKVAKGLVHMVDPHWVDTLTTLLEAPKNPTIAGRMWSSLLGGSVPGTVRSVAKLTNEVRRQGTKVGEEGSAAFLPQDLNAVRRHIPGLQGTVPPIRDSFGRTIPTRGPGVLGALKSFGSPFPEGQRVAGLGRVEAELEKYDIRPPRLSGKVGGGIFGEQLNTTAYTDVKKELGPKAYAVLEKVIASESYQKANRIKRELILLDVVKGLAPMGRGMANELGVEEKAKIEAKIRKFREALAAPPEP